MTIHVTVAQDRDVAVVKLEADSVPAEPVITSLTRDLRTLVAEGPVVIALSELGARGGHPAEQLAKELLGGLSTGSVSSSLAVVTPSAESGARVGRWASRFGVSVFVEVDAALEASRGVREAVAATPAGGVVPG